MFFGFNAFDPRHSPAVSAKQESYASSFTASALGCVRLACEFPQRPSTCARCRCGPRARAVLRAPLAAAPQSVGRVGTRTIWNRALDGSGDSSGG
jgi:hypothetical protein